MRGQLFGASLFQLQLVWLLFAASTWDDYHFVVSVYLQTTAS